MDRETDLTVYVLDCSNMCIMNVMNQRLTRICMDFAVEATVEAR